MDEVAHLDRVIDGMDKLMERYEYALSEIHKRVGASQDMVGTKEIRKLVLYGLTGGDRPLK